MKKFLNKIFYTVLLLIGSLYGISILYDSALSNNVNIKASYIQKHKIDANILIEGPCVPHFMIYPKLMEQITGKSVYNLSLPHSNFADNFLHLYLYLKNNTPPEYLFIYATPESMDERYNTFSAYRFAPYVYDSVVHEVVKECDPAYANWLNIPFMNYAYYGDRVNFFVLQGIKHYVMRKQHPVFPKGYEPNFFQEWDYTFEACLANNVEGAMYHWNELHEKYLRKIIALAHQNGIKVYLYESPVLEETIAHMPNRKELLARLTNVASENGVQYILFENMDMAKHKSYYTSPVNTNLLGAKIFTDSLGRFINSLAPHN